MRVEISRHCFVVVNCRRLGAPTPEETGFLSEIFVEEIASHKVTVLRAADSKIATILLRSGNIQIPVQGGMDPKILLTNKENLKKEAKKYLDIFKDHPYIFNLGHGILPDTNPDMMDYLVKMVKDH